MKKKTRFTLSLIFICIIWTVLASGISAAPNYKKLYGNYLKKGSVTVKTSSNGYKTIKMKHFLLLDIDQNGTKEMLTYDTDCYDVDVFTIKKGKVVYIGYFFNKYHGNEVVYCKKHKGLVTPSGGGGHVGYYMTALKNGKLYYKYTLLTETYGKGRSRFNNKLISKKKLRKYYKKYFAAKDQKTYIFYDNTSKNRKKRVK